jgi:hypothetical protein
MAVIVVGGSARGAGKTALVCGLVAALTEFAWIAVKIAGHGHGHAESVWEEMHAGEGTDTARYLAAGALRAFLVTALDSEIDMRLRELKTLVGHEANLIFESNRVLGHLRADLCLAIEPEAGAERKPSFALVEREKQATVRRVEPGAEEPFLSAAQAVFQLADFAHIPAPMQKWLRERVDASITPPAGSQAQS